MSDNIRTINNNRDNIALTVILTFNDNSDNSDNISLIVIVNINDDSDNIALIVILTINDNSDNIRVNANYVKKATDYHSVLFMLFCDIHDNITTISG